MTNIDSSEAVTTSDVVCFKTFSFHRNDLLSAQKVVTATLLVIPVIVVVFSKGNILFFQPIRGFVIPLLTNQRPEISEG